MTHKTHNYRGYEIKPVEYAEKAALGFRWYVQGYHQTGLAHSSQHCTHHATLAQAREDIDYRVQVAAEQDEIDRLGKIENEKYFTDLANA